MAPNLGSSSFSKSEHKPNDVDPLLPAIIAAVILCSILTTFFTAARLITQRFISAYNTDDYILLLAWVAGIAFNFCLLAAGLAGLGRHTGHIHRNLYVLLDKYIWALEIMYLPATWLAKASVLFQLIRVLTPTKSKPTYWACYVLIWSSLASYVFVFFAIIFQCHPIWKLWEQYYEDQCINWRKLLLASSAINMVFALLTLLLAISTTWQLQMTPKKKAGLFAIFAIGLLAFIASICRLVYTTHLTSTKDVSYVIAQTMLWSLTEITTTTLCAAFPSLPHSLRLLRDRLSRPPRPHPPPPPHPHPPPPPIPSSTPSPLKRIRKSKIFKIDNAKSSLGIGRGDVDMDWLKSPYRALGEGGQEGEGNGGEVVGVVRELGSKRTVGGIQRSRTDMKSWVASIV